MPVTSSPAAPSVAIVGAGAIGCAAAVFLHQRGHRPALWSPTASRLRREGQSHRIVSTGAVEVALDVDVLTNAAALGHYDVVLICLPGNAYQSILTPLARHWRDGQTLVVSGALSLSPLWLAQLAQARDVSLQVAGWGTTPTTAYFLPDGRLHMNPLRSRIDMAAVGGDEMLAPASALCTALLGDRFHDADNLLAPTLANINPIAHAAEVIPNLTRMDLGETWPLFGTFSPVVAHLAQGLDRERLAIARAFGLHLPTLQEHYARSYHIPLAPLEVMAADIHARGMGPNGPARLDHRYVLEDAPFGLAFQESLGALAGVATPVLSASLTLLEAIYRRDFRAENFLVEALGLAGMTSVSLRMRCAADRNAASLPR